MKSIKFHILISITLSVSLFCIFNYVKKNGKDNSMFVLSYKDFIEEVENQLGNLSTKELRNLILSWAAEEHPSRRHEFLDKLKPPKQKQAVIIDEEILIKDIEAFAKRVENGEYCDGWGWDDAIYEERDWGDESWAEEMDQFLLQGRNLVLQGKYKLAEDVYVKLFKILEMGQEPGHLPGDPDYASMLEVDLDEQLATFLRAVYMNTSSNERSNLLYKAMNEYGYIAHKIKLINIINALNTPLPDFEEFLDQWIDFLKNKSGRYISELLREAIFLKGGIPAIADFARQYSDTYPKAYIDWIKAIETKSDVASVLDIAREGLSRIPSNYIVRAEVAETISKIGEKMDDKELKLEGYRECFYSNPSMRYLLNLYIAAIECGCFEKIKYEVEERILEVLVQRDIFTNSYYDSEKRRSFASKRILFNALLLGGEYEKLFKKCKNKSSLGWSSGENPKPLFVTFIMILLSNRGVHSKVLYEQWNCIIRNTSFNIDDDYIKKYQRIIESIKDSIGLSEKQEEFYLKWCIKEIGLRTDAIVSNKHRKSYHKAAGLLVAIAETLANREQKQEGMNLIERYKRKYPRHIAFKREITEALQTSSLNPQ